MTASGLKKTKPLDDFELGKDIVNLLSIKDDVYLPDGLSKDDLIPLNPLSKSPRDTGWRKIVYTKQDLISAINNDCNIGYRIPINGLVIDVDPRNGGNDSFPKLPVEVRQLPVTTHTPSGGFHIYTLLPEGTEYRQLASTHPEFPGIDFLHHGKQVVVAGSSLRQESDYRWGNHVQFPAPFAPECLLKLLKGTSTMQSTKKNNTTLNLSNNELHELLPLLPVENYRDNDSWLRLAMACHHSTSGEGLEEFLEWSLSDPLYADDEHIIRTRWTSLSNNGESLVTIHHLIKEIKSMGELPGGLHKKINANLFSPFVNGSDPTDARNAEKLVELHGENIRYVPEFRKWLIWNGKIWGVDEAYEIINLATDTIRTLLANSLNIPDSDRKKKIIGKLMACESIQKLKAMTELAQSNPQVILRQMDLDQRLHLLNVNNGTMDLHSGVLLQHKRSHHLTQMIEVDYDIGSRCQTWLSFLNRSMDGNQNLIDYLQRAFGYSICGETSEQCLFFLYGNGANGKSTALNIFKKLMNNYAKQTSPETFMVIQKGSGGPSPELADLRGARVVITTEVEDGRQLAENLIKQATGQDPLSVRRLYCEPFEYIPQFKLWIAANHKPVIRGQDYAIWRRIHLVPFNVIIPEGERDKDLPIKLEVELPGILSWVIEGYKLWQKDGLRPPAEVKDATEEYKTEMDNIQQWIDECCVTGKNQQVTSTELYMSCRNWCVGNGVLQPSKNQLSRVLNQKGYKKTRSTTRGWQGLALKV